MAYSETLPEIDLVTSHPPRDQVEAFAVAQLRAALEARFTPATAREVFAEAGFGYLIDTPPVDRVDAATPAALFNALWRHFPSSAPEVAWKAGRLTGERIGINRIPAITRWTLKALPASAASPMLLKAITRHAWTFAGEGTCTASPARPGTPSVFTIVNNPLAMPGCIWQRGILTALFRALVCPSAQIEHGDCEHDGAPACRFVIHLSRFEPSS